MLLIFPTSSSCFRYGFIINVQSVLKTQNFILIFYNIYITIFIKHFKAWFHGVRRLGSRGNIDTLRMLSKPRYNITTRSMPMPPPACGGQPYLNASI